MMMVAKATETIIIIIIISIIYHRALVGPLHKYEYRHIHTQFSISSRWRDEPSM